MKRAWLLFIAAFLAPSSASFAADLRRPAPPEMMAPAYNWTGLYIGANFGGAWASGTLTDNLTETSLSGDRSGVIGGGTAGYNWQVTPNLVFGIEGTIDGTSIGRTSGTVTVPILGVPTAVQACVDSSWVATLAGRMGVTANNVLYYFKGGGVWLNNSATLTNAITGASVSASNTRGGGLAGIGIEYGFSSNWTLKIEYNWLGGSWTNSDPLLPGDTFNVSRNINVFTVGANYKLF
jgi:opacity protein-like surface antigen